MKKRIFLVEDDDDIRYIIEYILKDEYEVHSFANASLFKRTLDNVLPDLIILDVMLPDGNGIEICKDLHKMTSTSDIPVIIMSAHLDPFEAKAQACMQEFIQKPFEINYFIDKIHQQVA